MDRGASFRLATGMLVPVSLALVLSALTLPRQAYTGLVLRDDWVASVMAGSPAARAGFAHGDRIVLPSGAVASPLDGAHPGVPLTLLRERDGRLTSVRVVPGTLPDGEWRIRAALLALASGFVILGGWVWSERRDRLTRAFLLLCLAFAFLLAPWPKFEHASWTVAYNAVYSAVTLFVPALFVHFFALFPASSRPRGRRRTLTRVAYGVSATLVAVTLALVPLAPALHIAVRPALALVQALAGLWFLVGLLAAMALFGRSYRGARGDDERRRLRVALAGTALGVVPFAALVALRNLFPAAPLPGERWALALTLLVPASFGWAIAVHRVFEIRIALRAAAVCGAATVLAGAVFGAGEWLAAVWRPDLGHGLAGGALAFVALTATVAGPASRWAREMAATLVPQREDTLLEALARGEALRADTREHILAAACEVLTQSLHLDGVIAAELGEDGPRLVTQSGTMRVPAIPAPFAPVLRSHTPLAPEEVLMSAAARGALERAGVQWLVALGGSPRELLLLGRRLAGAWLSLDEIREVRRAASHLELVLENVGLRAHVRAHAGIDRELTRAGAIQAHLLPREVPSCAGLECAAASLACEAVGGDYYDFVQGDRGELTIAVGDAAGKGVPAALVGTWAQACFRSHARLGATPAGVLEALNRELVAMEQPDAFVALLCARIDQATGRFAFANAGLPPPILVRRGGHAEELSGGGVLLGVTPHARYGDVGLTLEEGDLVLFYTDGLSEARRGDELMGARRLLDRLRRASGGPVDALVHALLEEARAFADRPLDDITVVALRLQPAPVRLARVPLQTALKFPAHAADA